MIRSKKSLPKRHTDENEIICCHYSHAKSRQVKGVNLLSCLVNYGDISLEVDMPNTDNQSLQHLI